MNPGFRSAVIKGNVCMEINAEEDMKTAGANVIPWSETLHSSLQAPSC